MVKIPTVMHLCVCEKNLELISSRSHIHMARSKDHQRTALEVLLCTPTRFASGVNETLEILLLLPLSSLLFLFFYSFSSFSYLKPLLMDLESTLKGKEAE